MFGCVKYEIQLMDPAIGFIEKLAIKMRAKVLRTIGLLEEFGPQLPAPHSKTLKGCNGLKELRVKLGNNIVRLFYFHHKGKTYVVTSGYVKKTQKTNQQEIGRALRLMNKFLLWVAAANLFAWPAAYYLINVWLENFAFRNEITLSLFILSGLISLLLAILAVVFQSTVAALKNPAESLKYE